jgi:hypothetical protein
MQPAIKKMHPLDELTAFVGQYYCINYDIYINALSNLSLSSRTAPHYFAVTTDAIALGQWFDYKNDDRQTDRK